MLVELAVGDAYGAGFEYVDADFIAKHNDLSRYVKHPRHNIIPGYYTDDTQMSLAIAELLLSGNAWTPLNLAKKFVQVFKRDPREGYASRFYQFLQDTPDGETFLANIQPESDKSGAAMRAAPLGVLADTAEVIAKCRTQAAITHNTPDGINAAVAAALMAHYFIYEHGKTIGLRGYIDRHADGDWLQVWQGKVKSKGWMSVLAAITAVERNTSMSALLKDCIAFTGDVDTVATIALAAAAHSNEYIQDLPQHLIVTLENRVYGHDYLRDLDTKLMASVQK
ncbi:MAG: ADP-ribosylglycohydrolase family protein [Chloroflexota bacterium]